MIDGKRAAGFDVRHESTLTLAAVEMLFPLDSQRWLVAAWEVSPQARAELQQRGVSYAIADGEFYVHAPPVHIEIPASQRRNAPTSRVGERPAPFALRASRIPRWLLLNLETTPTFTELVEAVGLSDSNISRNVRALAEEALVRIDRDPTDARVRRVRLERPGPLLDAFERSTQSRRFRTSTWDIGVRDAEKAQQVLRRSAQRLDRPYALGGLAGASLVRPVVQPAALSVWIAPGDVEVWVEALDAFPARPGPGTLTLNVAPDPFVLSLAEKRAGFLVADPVQLYIDCRRAGERALEAAAAIREDMGW